MAELEVSAYPSELVRPLTLGDGSRLRLRPIRPDDAARLVELSTRLSPRTVYLRFFRTYQRLPDEWAARLATVDYRTRLALVAEDPSTGLLQAVGRYEPAEQPDVVEIALVVADEWQHRGLGGLILEAVLDAAEARGVHRFTASVLAENRTMLRLLSREAVVRHRELDHGVVTLDFERRHAATSDAAPTSG
jgi:acetyltransferase